MTDALLVTLVVLACVALLLECCLWGMIADVRTRLYDVERNTHSIDSLERGTNERVYELHCKWVRDRAEGRP